MSENKRYWWFKMTESFLFSKELDFLQGQTNGDKYVLLFFRLCMKTINTGGRLEEKIGNLIIRYDVSKIVRECIYYDYDTVVIALELYKKIGLICEDKDGCLYISNFEKFIDSETEGAKRMREWREKKDKIPAATVDKTVTMLPQCDNQESYPQAEYNKDITMLSQCDGNAAETAQNCNNVITDVHKSLDNDDNKINIYTTRTREQWVALIAENVKLHEQRVLCLEIYKNNEAIDFLMHELLIFLMQTKDFIINKRTYQYCMIAEKIELMRKVFFGRLYTSLYEKTDLGGYKLRHISDPQNYILMCIVNEPLVTLINEGII